MAPPLFGVLFRVLLGVGTLAVGAFKAAYSQTARAGGSGAAGAGAGAFGQKLNITKTQPMTAMEAQKILGLPKLAEGETVDVLLAQEKFEKMFKNNDVKNGGSFYIQSKIIRAKQFLELELIKENKLPEEDRIVLEERTKKIVEEHTNENQS